jgi:DNA-directed RNA polymerase beta' subunit
MARGSNEDDLTKRLMDIVHTNETLKSQLHKGQHVKGIMEVCGKLLAYLVAWLSV